MNHLKSLIYASILLGTISVVPISAYAEEETDTQSNTTETYDFKPSGMKYYGSSTSALSRKVTTAIGVYAKSGTVPKITRYDSTYSGTKIHVMTVDASNGDTFLQVDYADSPAYLNNFYDSSLTKNDEYYWSGSINAGFFNATASSNSYGLATGAVRHNYAWETYSYVDGTYYGELQPSYGSGFVTAYLNKNDDFQLIYNGWKGGVFYKYYGDSDPNTWDYSPVWDYSEGVSGAYTLLVNGEEVHWGKNDYSDTNYWNYLGSAITLFGQKANGDYVLVTTTAGSLYASQQVALMKQLGCTNAIRFDGGGSSQMAYTNGLTLASASVSSSIEVNDADTNNIIDYVVVTVKDNAGSTHTVKASDLARKDGVTVTDNGDNTYSVTVDTVVGTLKTTVTNKVSVVEHTVKFYDYYGDVIATKTVKDGEAIDTSDITVPNVDGYEFDKWDQELTNVKADLEVQALYKLKSQIHISFDWNYANSGFVGDIVAISGSEVLLPENNYVKDGYKFTSWNTSIDGSGEEFDANESIKYSELADLVDSDGNIKLYAQWEKKPIYYISFDWNYANSGFVSDITSYEGDEVSLPENNYVKYGYKFNGWSLTGNSEIADYQPNDKIVVEGNIKLYACWKQNEYVTLSFDWNYANSGEIVPITAGKGESVTLPEITYIKDGYHATQWNTSINGDGETYNVGDTVYLEDNLMLYPIWVEDETNELTVSFDWNYANSGFVADIKTADGQVTLPECSYAKDGYTFIGWSLDIDDQEGLYQPEQIITIDVDTKLYAQWVTSSPSLAILQENSSLSSIESEHEDTQNANDASNNDVQETLELDDSQNDEIIIDEAGSKANEFSDNIDAESTENFDNY